jgi:hypothetical protein
MYRGRGELQRASLHNYASLDGPPNNLFRCQKTRPLLSTHAGVGDGSSDESSLPPGYAPPESSCFNRVFCPVIACIVLIGLTLLTVTLISTALYQPQHETLARHAFATLTDREALRDALLGSKATGRSAVDRPHDPLAPTPQPRPNDALPLLPSSPSLHNTSVNATPKISPVRRPEPRGKRNRTDASSAWSAWSASSPPPLTTPRTSMRTNDTRPKVALT